MIDVAAAGSHCRRNQWKAQPGIVEQLRINLGFARALIRPLIKTRKLHVQYRRLQLIESTIDPNLFMLVLVRAAVRAQPSQTRCYVVVPGRENSAITCATEILRRIKTETSDHAH